MHLRLERQRKSLKVSQARSETHEPSGIAEVTAEVVILSKRLTLIRMTFFPIKYLPQTFNISKPQTLMTVNIVLSLVREFLYSWYHRVPSITGSSQAPQGVVPQNKTKLRTEGDSTMPSD